MASGRIRHLAPFGAIDQFTDSTDALGDLRLTRVATAAVLRE